MPGESDLTAVAIPPISPSYPRDLLTMAAVGCITLLLSIAYALLRPSFDTRFRTAQDIAVVLGLQTLASVQRISRNRRREALNSAVGLLAAGPPCFLVDGALSMGHQHP